ncbi:unnamed protein product [Calicophoron daubneyi]|uniref:Uncharacterized protein n=1 Tax=Calicophoron daubneyi TaxID=300641 RepID=A0AAV2T8B7_CALDB
MIKKERQFVSSVMPNQQYHTGQSKTAKDCKTITNKVRSKRKTPSEVKAHPNTGRSKYRGKDSIRKRPSVGCLASLTSCFCIATDAYTSKPENLRDGFCRVNSPEIPNNLKEIRSGMGDMLSPEQLNADNLSEVNVAANALNTSMVPELTFGEPEKKDKHGHLKNGSVSNTVSQTSTTFSVRGDERSSIRHCDREPKMLYASRPRISNAQFQGDFNSADPIIRAANEIVDASKRLSVAIESFRERMSSYRNPDFEVSDRALDDGRFVADSKNRKHYNGTDTFICSSLPRFEEISELSTSPHNSNAYQLLPYKTIEENPAHNHAVRNVLICIEDVDPIEPIRRCAIKSTEDGESNTVKPRNDGNGKLLPTTDQISPKSKFSVNSSPLSGSPNVSEAISPFGILSPETHSNCQTLMTSTFQPISTEETQVTEVDEGLTTDESEKTDSLSQSTCQHNHQRSWEMMSQLAKDKTNRSYDKCLSGNSKPEIYNHHPSSNKNFKLRKVCDSKLDERMYDGQNSSAKNDSQKSDADNTDSSYLQPFLRPYTNLYGESCVQDNSLKSDTNYLLPTESSSLVGMKLLVHTVEDDLQPAVGHMKPNPITVDVEGFPLNILQQQQNNNNSQEISVCASPTPSLQEIRTPPGGPDLDSPPHSGCNCSECSTSVKLRIQLQPSSFSTVDEEWDRSPETVQNIPCITTQEDLRRGSSSVAHTSASTVNAEISTPDLPSTFRPHSDMSFDFLRRLPSQSLIISPSVDIFSPQINTILDTGDLSPIYGYATLGGGDSLAGRRSYRGLQTAAFPINLRNGISGNLNRGLYEPNLSASTSHRDTDEMMPMEGLRGLVDDAYESILEQIQALFAAHDELRAMLDRRASRVPFRLSRGDAVSRDESGVNPSTAQTTVPTPESRVRFSSPASLDSQT